MSSHASGPASSVEDYLSSGSEKQTMSPSPSESNEEEVDDSVCNKQLPCGNSHTCMKLKNHSGLCGKCPYVRMYERECGHKTVDKCIYGFTFNLPTCEEICGKIQICSHRCKRPCYACDGNCSPLMCDRCQWKVYCLDQKSDDDGQTSSVDDSELAVSLTEDEPETSRGSASESGSDVMMAADSGSGSDVMMATDCETESEHGMLTDSESELEHAMAASSESGSDFMLDADSESGPERMMMTADSASEAESEQTITADSESGSEYEMGADSESESKHAMMTADYETGSERAMTGENKSGSENAMSADSENEYEYIAATSSDDNNSREIPSDQDSLVSE